MKKWIQKSTLCLWLLGVFLICNADLTQASEIKIGVILAETGPASFLGGPEVRSLQMLSESINAAGGIKGNKLVLVYKDSGASAEKAVSFAKQLIDEEKVFAIIGPSTSGETLKIKKMCEQTGTILISCASAEVIVDPVAKYVFKTAPNDSLAARQIFKTMQGKNISKIAVLSGNDGFGNAGQAQLTKLAPEYGIQILADEVYDKEAKDLSALVAKIKAIPDLQAVVNWSIVPAQSIIAKNIRQTGWDIPLYQSHGFANIKYVEVAGVAAEGIIFPASRLVIADTLPPGAQKDFLMRYKTAYESRFKEDVSTFGGHAYDALTILTKAIEEAGFDKEKVRDEIEKTTGYFGTAGEFNFSPTDHCGLDLNAFTMITVKDGRFVAYKQ